MEEMAWYNAWESRASGHINVRHGFSVGPSFIDIIPQVFLSKKERRTSGEFSGILGRANKSGSVITVSEDILEDWEEWDACEEWVS
jgi:hypothetical protein